MMSSAIDAVQDGINGIKVQLDRSANSLGGSFFPGLNKSLFRLLDDAESMRTVADKDKQMFNKDIARDDNEDEHLRKYGGRLLGGSDCERAQKAVSTQKALVRQATVLDGCLDGGQYLPVFYILKAKLCMLQHVATHKSHECLGVRLAHRSCSTEPKKIEFQLT